MLRNAQPWSRASTTMRAFSHGERSARVSFSAIMPARALAWGEGDVGGLGGSGLAEPAERGLRRLRGWCERGERVREQLLVSVVGDRRSPAGWCGGRGGPEGFRRRGLDASRGPGGAARPRGTGLSHRPADLRAVNALRAHLAEFGHPSPSVVAKGIHNVDRLLEAVEQAPEAGRPAFDLLADQLRDRIETVTKRIEAARTPARRARPPRVCEDALCRRRRKLRRLARLEFPARQAEGPNVGATSTL